MKRLLAFAAVIALCVGGLALPAAADQVSAKWEYEVLEDGTACITGFNGPKEIEIPAKIDGIPVTRIGDKAFLACSGLKKVTIPDSVTSIGAYAFAMCRGLKELVLPAHLERIGASAFMDCRNVASMEIPDSVNCIEGNPFGSCFKLSEIVVSPDHPYLEMADGALFSKPDRRLICVPMVHTLTEYAVPEGTEMIASHAFTFGTMLESITIPDSVWSIGEEAFSRCDNLKSLTIPESVTEIARRAFMQSKALEEVVLPDGLKEIPEQAFYFCESLAKVNIPSALEKIGRQAFYNCKLDMPEIPDGVEIGDEAFGKPGEK